MRDETFERIQRNYNMHINTLIHGLPATGKTMFTQDFCKKFHISYVYFDCERDFKEIDLLLDSARNSIDNLIEFIRNYCYLVVESISNTILIFDNVENCDVVINDLYPLLKNYNFNLMFTITVKSKLIKTIINDFDVVVFRPATLEDSINSVEKGLALNDAVNNIFYERSIPSLVNDIFTLALNDYLDIGGMADCLVYYKIYEEDNEQMFLHIKDIEYNHIVKKLYERGQLDDSAIYKCEQIIESIIKQMATSDYTRYKIASIREGVTYSKYKEAFDFLIENHFLLKVKDIDKKSFELYYLFDVAILCDRLNQYISKNRISCDKYELDKIIKRNFMVSEAAAKNEELYYWKSKYTAFVDLIIPRKKLAFALIADGDMRSKALNEFDYKDQYKCFYVSNNNFTKKYSFLNIPLYAISSILKKQL